MQKSPVSVETGDFVIHFIRPDTLNLLGGGKPPALQYEFHTNSIRRADTSDQSSEPNGLI